MPANTDHTHNHIHIRTHTFKPTSTLMENPQSTQYGHNNQSDRSGHHPPVPETATITGRKRTGSAASILSKFPFMRTSESKSNLKESRLSPFPSSGAGGDDPLDDVSAHKPQGALSAAMSQQKTRRRKGSLRKVALLGRGAARERRDLKPLAIDTAAAAIAVAAAQDTTRTVAAAQQPINTLVLGTEGRNDERHHHQYQYDQLGILDASATPRPSMDGFARRPPADAAALTGIDLPVVYPPSAGPEPESPVTSPTISYTSTTDEEDGLSIPVHRPSPLQLSSLSSSQESFFHHHHSHSHHHHHRHQDRHHHYLSPSSVSPSVQRRRSVKQQQQQRAKSPLSSLQGLAVAAAAVASSPLPVVSDGGDHDYGETERWGWVVLAVTWSVFVVGMGSCLNVWRWAWDVGGGGDASTSTSTSSTSTPYAPPPELDTFDPTLPIVGYYPALLILTCIMAWVWVVVAWIGM